MTIKELEERTGLARANIRFYEQEGLICPLRRPNGYRDYSEEDVRTLEKIKLLRRLRLDLDAIRRLQAGTLTLAGAMQAQMETLDRDRAEAEAARQVCRRLRDSGEGYETLSPLPYLQELDRAPAGPHMAPLPADRAETVAHPWVRFFARALDGALYGLLWAAVQLLVLGWVPVTEGEKMQARAAGWCVSILLFFAIEPVLLSAWGTTPGKALFGLKVRRSDGGKLSWRQALRRLTGVYVQGQCFTIPVAELFFWWKSYKLCRDGFPLPWEEDTTYTVKDRASWRGAAFGAAYLAVFLASFPLRSQAVLPPNRGELTVAEFAENYNELARMLGVDSRLDGEGALVLAVNSDVMAETLPELIYTLEDGTVTGVEVRWETDRGHMTWDHRDVPQLAVLSLLAAQKSVNCLNYPFVVHDAETWMGDWTELWTLHGVSVYNQNLGEGYFRNGGQYEGFLHPVGDGAHFYQMDVRITLKDQTMRGEEQYP